MVEGAGPGVKQKEGILVRCNLFLFLKTSFG